MEDLGKSLAEAEGLIEAESNSNKPHPNEFCLNCNTKLIDTYCHHCGQKDIPRRQGLSDLLSNIISSFTNYEGKFLQTAKFLFLKPGFLAIEYNNGRREHYFHPVRMYVFVSAIFFLLFVTLPDAENGAVQAGLNEEDKEELAKIGITQDSTKKDSTKTNLKWQFNKGLFKTHEQYDSAQAATPEKDRHSWWERKLQHRAIDLEAKYGDDSDALGKEFFASFSDHFSSVLFYLMPLMALLLKLLYVRRDYYYSEHLALTICYYNFFYLAATLIMLINLVWWLSPISAIIGMWIYFYLLFAMKRVYQQGWGKTIMKFLLFTVLFSFLIIFGVLLNGVVSLMTI